MVSSQAVVSTHFLHCSCHFCGHKALLSRARSVPSIEIPWVPQVISYFFCWKTLFWQVPCFIPATPLPEAAAYTSRKSLDKNHVLCPAWQRCWQPFSLAHFPVFPKCRVVCREVFAAGDEDAAHHSGLKATGGHTRWQTTTVLGTLPVWGEEEKVCRLPRWLRGKEPACQCKRHGFDPWGGKSPWRRKWQPTPVFLPGASHGQRRLAGYSPQGRQESDMNERLILITDKPVSRAFRKYSHSLAIKTPLSLTSLTTYIR